MRERRWNNCLNTTHPGGRFKKILLQCDKTASIYLQMFQNGFYKNVSVDFLKNCDVQRREIWAIFSRLALRERYKVARNLSRTKHKLALWIKIRIRTKPKNFLCKKNSIPTIFLTLYAVAWPPPLFPVTLHKSVLLVQQGVEISRIAYKKGLVPASNQYIELSVVG